MAVPKRKTSRARRDARRVDPCRRRSERERVPAVPQPQAVRIGCARTAACTMAGRS